MAMLGTEQRPDLADLVRTAVDDAQRLVRLEIELARNEMRSEFTSMRTSAVAFGVAGGSSIVAVSLLLVALVLATGAHAWVALLIGVVLLVTAGASAYVGYRAIPKKPLQQTRERIEADAKKLREQVA
jgi:uncharacterized membrane protein YqjE